MSTGTKIVMISDNISLEETAFDLSLLGSCAEILTIINEHLERKRPFKRATISIPNERLGSGLILGGSRI